MKTSASGLAFIARQEGEVLHVYRDSAGVPTIGIGHALRPGEAFPNGITHEQALEMLAADVRIAEAAVNAGSHAANAGTLPQNAFDALVSFTYNEGGGAFATSNVRRLLNVGDMPAAAEAFKLWVKRKDPKTGELVTDADLVTRRKEEAALFLTPDVAPSERETQPDPLDTAPSSEDGVA